MTESTQPSPEAQTPVKKTGFARILGRKVLGFMHRTKAEEVPKVPEVASKPAETVQQVPEQAVTTPEATDEVAAMATRTARFAARANGNAGSYLSVAQGTIRRTMAEQPAAPTAAKDDLEEFSHTTLEENNTTATSQEAGATPLATDNDPLFGEHTVDPNAATPMHDTLQKEHAETATYAALRTEFAAQGKDPVVSNTPDNNRAA